MKLRAKIVCVGSLSERPAHIKAEIVSARPYPRHRGDPYLAELRHEVFAHLGLDATW